MANQKHKNTPLELISQKKRTYKNQVKRYEALLSKYPEHTHAKKWRALVEFYSVPPTK